MKTILNIIRKEFIQIRQDKKMFGISFLAPILQLLVLGYGASLDVSEIPMVVCDMDRSAESRDLIDHFTANGSFTVQGYTGRLQDVDAWLDNGQASIALVIPKEFEKKLGNGNPAPLQVIADGTESSSASIGFSYALMIVMEYSAKYCSGSDAAARRNFDARTSCTASSRVV